MILIAKSLGYISKVSIFVCKLIIMLMNFLELVKARYSARKYAGRSVEIEKLEYIMECVRLAPSAVNFQPWRFKIVTDEPTLKALQQCYKLLRWNISVWLLPSRVWVLAGFVISMLLSAALFWDCPNI